MVSWLKELNIFERIILSLIIIGFLLYANSFANEMFWDDDDGIINNQYIKNWEYFPKYFSENLIAGAGLLSNYWRPMILTVFSVEWHLWQDWILGYHLINTLFHIVDAILLFLVLLYLFKSYYLSFLTSLFFLVHPLQTEAVTYVSGIGDSLSVFFILLGILFYLKFRKSGKIYFKNKFYFLAFLMYIFALMSKETAFVMPGFIFLVDFFFLQRVRKTSLRERLGEILKAIWPFIVLAGSYLLLRATSLNFINTFNLYNEQNIFTSNVYFRILTFFKVLTVYFKLLFFPFNLHMERSIGIATSFNSFPVISGAVLFLGLLILAFLNLKKLPIVSFGIFWFFTGLFLTSNILVPINGLLYEHWLYLPMVGIFLSLIWIGKEFVKNKDCLKKVFLIIIIIFLIFLGSLTMRRNREWKDPITFYNQTLSFSPDNYRIINNLCMEYNKIGEYEKAEEVCKKAIDVDISAPVAYHNLANAYKNMGEIELAEENFLKAIEIDPGFIFSYNALVNIYLEREDYKETIEILRRIEEIRPGDESVKELIKNINNLIEFKK